MRKDIYRVVRFTVPKPNSSNILVFIKGQRINFDIIGNKLKLNRVQVERFKAPILANIWGYRTVEEQDIIMESEHFEQMNAELRETLSKTNKHILDKNEYIENLERKISKVASLETSLLKTIQTAKDVNSIIGANIIDANKTIDKLMDTIEEQGEYVAKLFESYTSQMSDFKKATNELLVSANKALNEGKQDTLAITEKITAGIKEVNHIAGIRASDIVAHKKDVQNKIDGFELKIQHAKNMLTELKTQHVGALKDMFRKQSEPKKHILLKDLGNDKITILSIKDGKLMTGGN